MKTHSIINRSYIALRELIDDVNDHLLALGKLDEPVQSWDTIALEILSRKLDATTLGEWKERVLTLVREDTSEISAIS